MPKAITVATFTRAAGDQTWGTPKITRPRDFIRPWEPENMVSIGTNSLARSVLVNVDTVETSMMARLSLEDAIALRKELNNAISAVRKESFRLSETNSNKELK